MMYILISGPDTNSAFWWFDFTTNHIDRFIGVVLLSKSREILFFPMGRNNNVCLMIDKERFSSSVPFLKTRSKTSDAVELSFKQFAELNFFINRLYPAN